MAIPKRLQQIDQNLIQLLSERISVLATSAPSMQEQLAGYESQLNQAGVPHHVWSSIITSCMAVANTAALQESTQPLNSLRRITVVGGKGMMGRFFCDRLIAAGHKVEVLEYDGWEQAERLLGQADLVLLCVPLHATPAIVRRVAQYLSPNTILADIASTKTAIVETMLEHHSGPVLGLHPMFGPGVKSFLAQKVVVCSGRYPDASNWFLDWIAAEGGKLIHCTPEEHDRMMVVVQAIRHFSTFSLGVFLAEAGIDINRSLDFASPIYRHELNLVSRLFAQEGGLYIDIMLASEQRLEAIDQMAKTCNRLSNLVQQQDRDGLMAEFETARPAFQAEADRSWQESNHVINQFSAFLAATEVEATRSTLDVAEPLVAAVKDSEPYRLSQKCA